MELTLRPLALPREAPDSVEVVERKGLGHPDTLCDMLAEALSLSLSRFYRERFGLILHHNVDKVLLHAGRARPEFGGGDIVEPIEVYLSGRATREFGGVEVPVDELAVEGSRDWLRRHLRTLDPERHVVIHPLLRPGSRDLVELYLRAAKQGRPLANDTSCGVGYAPLSRLERVVLATERRLNSPAVKEAQPWIGEDVKVMGLRHGVLIDLTVACAFVDRHVRDLKDYAAKKDAALATAREAALGEGAAEATLRLNTADDISKGSVYLTVTGTSAEAGDDGQAGRGNRVNGLIAPYRPMTMESVAGKNAVTHVGKIYNITAGLMADAIVRNVPGVSASEVYLVSRIGQPVAEPAFVDIRIASEEGRPLASMAALVREVAAASLARTATLADDMLAGRIAFDRWPLESAAPA
ncbi:MAG: methionine adenosyltransferase [Alphaproteobacteria bacterium]